MKSYNGFTPEQRMEGERQIKAAIAAGTLKPCHEVGCEVPGCGQRDGILQNHCEDYSRAVEDRKVVCWRCHMMIHRRFRAPEASRRYFRQLREGHGAWPPVHKHDFSTLDHDHGTD